MVDKQLKEEIEDYKKIINDIEDDFRHDLSVHLYSTVLLHKLDPFYPIKTWTSWPLKVNVVPDPKTTKIYSDSLIDRLENPTSKRTMKAIRYSTQRDDSYGKKNAIPKTVKRHRLEEDDKVQDDDGTDGAVSEGEEINRIHLENIGHIVEEESDSDEEFQMRISSPESDMDQQSQSDSEMDNLDTNFDNGEHILHPEQKTLKLQEIKFIDTATDYRNDLYTEIKAQIQKLVHKKIKKTGLLVAEGLTTEFSNETTDEITIQLVNKIDQLFSEMFKLFHQNSHRNTRLLTWQDILIAGLYIPQGIFKTTSHQEFYQKSENLFLNPKFNYKYNNIEVDSDRPFEFYDFLDQIDQTRGMRKHQVPSDQILNELKLIKQETDLKKNLFEEILCLRKEQERISSEKGYIKRGAKRFTKIGESSGPFPKDPRELPEYALKQFGIRINEDEYYLKL